MKNEDLQLDLENLNTDNFKMEQKIDILQEKITKFEAEKKLNSDNSKDDVILKK